jgi:hypothetical protein
VVARKHHYVPQCYLKGFAVEREPVRQVQVFDRVSRKTFVASIANIAAEKDFNTVDLEGHAPDVFEQIISSFETELALSLDRIRSTESFEDQDDRTNVLNLIAVLAVRHPGQRENYRHFHERISKSIMSGLVSSRRMWESTIRKASVAGYISPDADTDYERMKDYVLEGNYRIHLPNEMHMKAELAGVDAILPYLGGRGWMLVNTPPRSGGFVTSDRPVSLIWSEPRRGPIGFGLRGTEVIFPLSNRLALMGAFDIEDEVNTATEEFVAEINGLTISQSRRQVYARDRNFLYTSQQGERPREASRLMTDGIFTPDDDD